MKRIAVIGAGPAGMAAAISAARSGAKVTVFERNNIPGKKLLLTGNGKCNFTNVDVCADYYSFSEGSMADLVLMDVLYVDICHAFMKMGVLSRERKGGIYPFTEQASTIQTALIRTMERLGVELITDTCIGNVTKDKDVFIVHTDKDIVFDAVILACGGKAAPKTGSDGFGYRLARGFGHTVTRTYPALVQLVSDAPNLKSIAGVRCHANVSAYINGVMQAKDYGEVQITDYGLSGIPVFNLSRHLTQAVEEGEKCSIIVDFIPKLSMDAIESYVKEQYAFLKGYTFKAFLEGMIHSKLVEYVLKETCNEQSVLITEADIIGLIELLKVLKSWNFNITGHKGYEHAQVTKGGVLLDEIDEDMQSKLVKGLYFAGEMLDVDADCGGYNLHWAWVGGNKAGEEAAK